MGRAKAAAPAGGFSLTLDRSALVLALGSVIRAVEGKGTIPILTHILLHAEGDALTVTGTNLDQQVTIGVAADVSGPGSITLPAHTLHDLARRLPGDARVTIAVPADKPGAATVTAGRSRSTLPTLPVQDFPELIATQADQGRQTIELAGTVLADMIGRCAFAISSEETRYYLNGIYVHVIERAGALALRFVSTDGHRLARIDSAHASGLALEMPGAIIPTKGVGLFAAAAKDAGDAPLRLELTPRTARLITPTGEIVTKLVDGTFPDYDRITPRHFARESSTATLALAETLERVGSLSDEKGRRVRVDFEADRIAITLPHQADGTTGNDEVEAELTGEPLAIGFNPRYFSEILKHSGADKLTIYLGDDATQPAVIRDKSGDALYILMPMRI